jgi:hypothetical protein
MVPEYQDFLFVVDGSPGAYSVEAQGPGGVRVPPTRFAYEETDQVHAILGRIRAGLTPSREGMQTVGAALFDALFPRPVIRAFERAPDALPPGAGLRLKLVVRPPELGELPWELLYDPDQEVFLAARLSVPLVRFVESGTPAASLLARRPLRVLQVLASPADAPALDLTVSEAALREALGDAGEVQVVRATTPATLRDALRQQPGFHVLHYDGHGGFDEGRGEGFLILHDEEGQSYPLAGEMLASYLDGTSVRLAVLSACESAIDSAQKRFSGIAGQLMRAGNLPAVVAMQFAVPDASALAFSREFYRALADDYPVDAATVEGRKAILEHLGGDAAAFASPDWAAPVLFLRVEDGEILREEMEGREMSEEEKDRERGGIHVDTGGGQAYVGDITVQNGDFVGGKKIVYGDEVRGDKVSGDKYTVGDITGSNVALGQGAQATHTEGVSGEDLASLFAQVYRQIEARPEDPDVDKEELAETVQKVEQEAAKGEAANPTKIERWLRFLGGMAPDILDVTVACLTNPLAGVGTVIHKIAEKARAEAGSA